MKDVQLILSNFCQHRDITVNFAGMVGIVGPNGSGKSHIREALVFAKTGYLEFPKKDYITFGETKGSVTLVFVTEEDGMTYKVTRNLHNGDIFAFRQTADGWESISYKPSSARNFVSEVIPMSADLATYMYASNQTKLTDLADATPAERSRIFSGIFALQFLEKDRKKIRDILQKVEARANDTKSRLLLLEDQLAAKRSALQAYPTLLPSSAIETSIKQVTEELDAVTKELGDGTLRVFLVSEIKKYESLLEKCNYELQEQPPEETEKTSLMELDKEMDACSKSKIDIVYAIQCLRRWNSRTIPEEVSESVLAELQTKSGILQARTDQLHNHYMHVVSCGTSGKCPTCGRELDYTESDLVKAQSDYMRSVQELEDLNLQIRNMASDLAKYRKVQANNEHLLHDWKNALQELGYDDLGEDQLSELRTKVDKDLDTLSGRYALRADYEKLLYEWDSRHKELLNRRDTLEQKLQEMRTNPVMLMDASFDSTELQKRKYELTQKYDALQDVRIKRVQYDACKSEVESLELEVRKAKDALEATRPQLREYLTEIEEMLQSKRLPAKVIASLNRVLAKKLNSYLSEFNAPYSVDIKSTGDFVCKYSENTIPASRLSGGEKMVLSVAFRLALHSLFSSDDTGGFVILDEPTTFMDEKNREALTSVLTTLKKSPKFKDLQIIVITHDVMMIPVFDTLVRLEK